MIFSNQCSMCDVSAHSYVALKCTVQRMYVYELTYMHIYVHCISRVNTTTHAYTRAYARTYYLYTVIQISILMESILGIALSSIHQIIFFTCIHENWALSRLASTMGVDVVQMHPSGDKDI